MSSPTKVSAGLTSGVIKIADKASATGTSASSQAGAVVQLNSSEKIPSQYLSTGVHLGGIDSAHLLDDYEEGSWSPTLTSGPTITGNSSHYVKVGDLVFIYAYFQRNDASANSNDFILTNLPFAPNTGTRVNSNGTGTWTSYAGSSDRRTGFINTSNDGSVYMIKSGTAVHATYDQVVDNNRGFVAKWFYYTS